VLFESIWFSFLFVASLQPALDSPIVGDYMEDRSNHVHGCYCEWSGESVTGGKDAILAWRFTGGASKGVPLAGVRIVAVIKGEDSLSTTTAPRQTVLFTDAAATQEQRLASERLLRTRFAGLFGEVIDARPAPVVFEISANDASVTVADLVHLKMRKAVLPQDALPGAIKWFDAFVPMSQSTLAATLEVGYAANDFGEKWSKSEVSTSGYFGRVRMSAP
jgi:hypothetical protein